jgi:hypothetical protein
MGAKRVVEKVLKNREEARNNNKNKLGIIKPSKISKI